MRRWRIAGGVLAAMAVGLVAVGIGQPADHGGNGDTRLERLVAAHRFFDEIKDAKLQEAERFAPIAVSAPEAGWVFYVSPLGRGYIIERDGTYAKITESTLTAGGEQRTRDVDFRVDGAHLSDADWLDMAEPQK